MIILTGPDLTRCEESTEIILHKIEKLARPGDIVFLASLRMPELLNHRELTDQQAIDSALKTMTQESREGALASAKDVLERLFAAKVHVIIDAPKPLFRAPLNRCSDWFNNSNPVCSAGFEIDRIQLERLRAPQMHIISHLESEYPDLIIWDPFPILCPGIKCSARSSDKLPLYFDSNHLSGHGNRLIEPSFNDLLQKTLDKNTMLVSGG